MAIGAIKPDEVCFRTTRLTIHAMRDIRDSHIAALNDRSHMRYSEQRHKQHTFQTQINYVSQQSPEFLLLDLCKTENESVGSLSVHIDLHNAMANLGLLIIPSETGRGYGKEAWIGTMAWLFMQGIHKIEAGTPSTNWHMRKIIRAARMALEGRRRGAFLMDDGRRVDLMLFGRTRED